MSTKRRAIDRSKPPGGGGPFTPEVIATFKRLLALDDDYFEYRAVCKRLDVLLGFDEPWTRFSPAYVQVDSKPPTWSPRARTPRLGPCHQSSPGIGAGGCRHMTNGQQAKPPN